MNVGGGCTFLLSDVRKPFGDGYNIDFGRYHHILNPVYFARKELATYLGRLSEADAELRERTEQLRRRPRGTGKPL